MCVSQRDVQRVREVAALVLDGMEIPDGVAHEELVELRQLLERLYMEQSQLTPNAYLETHGTPAAIDAQVRTFLWYRQFITGSIRVLDWGCNHGPDSALLRAWRGDDLQLHGCDRGSSSDYEVFRSFSQVSYSELDSQFVLPYENDQFDAVIASGVIEHVASDMRSLEELHRIVRPAGRLVITFLPNWLSLHELKLRRSGEDGAHDRTYSRRHIRQLLLHFGFLPISPVVYQTGAWARQIQMVFGRTELARHLVDVARVVAPAHAFRASTLCVVAEKVEAMR